MPSSFVQCYHTGYIYTAGNIYPNMNQHWHCSYQKPSGALKPGGDVLVEEMSPKNRVRRTEQILDRDGMAQWATRERGEKMSKEKEKEKER
jgi:hypothetical protein